ncbi:MAG: glycosyltransferase family 2 protein [Mangrovicoccus sp.]
MNTISAPANNSVELPELTVIVVSYNTKELTLACLRTLYANTYKTRFHCVVLDNDSKDGSADAVAAEFPQAELIRSAENLGFAKANNVVAAAASTEWLLLLNPDTEVHDKAVDNLLDFAKAHPEAGITGGRTVFPDGSLNRGSCWMRITPWSTVCNALALSWIFADTNIFNPEAIGAWKRDTVREVDIVVGCFLMIRRELWNELEGFDLKYFMYGEEADLCLRAKAKGYRPMINPNAEIMHLEGAASVNYQARKYKMIARARATLIRQHWPAGQINFGLAMMSFWAGSRAAIFRVVLWLTGKKRDSSEKWGEVWAERHDWLKGY